MRRNRTLKTMLMAASVSALLAFPILVCASQIDAWLHDLDHPRYPENALKSQDSLQRYGAYDFSPLLVPRSEFLGYIGNDYQRLRIHLKSISRDPDHQDRYVVVGESKVRDNLTPFDGSVTVTSIREYAHMHYGVDEGLKSAGIRSEGVLIGRYRFEEQQAQPHSGVFEGVVTLYWYVDKDGKLRYDDIQVDSDNYSNNQYVGTWTSYTTRKSKVANWGEYRIPFSGDLDIGAGEFSPDPRYKDRGWSDYRP